ncbi:hypothetical protein LLH00_07090 [bacterium]|nr:hypothetical protein [bacterium]
MVRPIDHATVMQQFTHVEKESQQQQSHPELSRLQSEQNELKRAAEERRRTKETSPGEKTKIHPDEGRKDQRRQRRGRRRGSSGDGRGSNVDLLA